MERNSCVEVYALDSPFNSKTQSARGFVTMTFMIILPIFISISFLFMALVYGIYHDSRAYSLCYKTGAKIQMQLKRKLNQLMLLNSQAKKLRRKRKTASNVLKSSLLTANPVIIAEAYSQLLFVKMLQKKFSIQQRRIFFEGRAIIQKEWMKFKKDSHRWVRKIQKIKPHNPFAVQKSPLNSASPSYTPMPQFSNKQKIKIEWMMNVFQFLPSFIQEKFNFNSYMKHHCTVSLSRLGNKFQVQLMK